MGIKSIAKQFVNLVLKYKNWDEVKTLPASEVEVFFKIVKAAGFKSKAIVQGKLVGHYYRLGKSTDETYPINILCPFKVVGQEDEDLDFATGWLDCAVFRVVYDASHEEDRSGIFDIIREAKTRDQIIETIVTEIKQSVPFKPIQLTREGDILCERPPRKLSLADFEYFVEHLRDDRQFKNFTSIHEHCNGLIARTETHDAIICCKCHVQVPIPKDIKTYGDLRRNRVRKLA